MTPTFQKIANAWKQRTILAKLFSFASIGVINVVIDLSVFTIALQIVHLPLVASNVVAWPVVWWLAFLGSALRYFVNRAFD